MYKKRIEWLSRGSRELFGTIVERNMYILIDTSQSMHMGLDFVKQKLLLLMQVRPKIPKFSLFLDLTGASHKGAIEIQATVQSGCIQQQN